MAYVSLEFYNIKINKFIAVTGTNGKTSVAYFIYHLLKKLNNKVGIIGTIGNSISENINSNLTTPDPITLSKILHKMTRKKNEICCYGSFESWLTTKKIIRTQF